MGLVTVSLMFVPQNYVLFSLLTPKELLAERCVHISLLAHSVTIICYSFGCDMNVKKVVPNSFLLSRSVL